eukprot:SAG11_NODE_4618_length_1832_cov_2.000577_1_plen_318_part_00
MHTTDAKKIMRDEVDVDSPGVTLLPVSHYVDGGSASKFAISAGARPSDGGLFGCFGDMETCCVGFLCPCLLFGSTLKQSGETSSTCRGVLIYLCTRLFVSFVTFAFILWPLASFVRAASDPICRCGMNSTWGNSTTDGSLGSGGDGWDNDWMQEPPECNGHGHYLDQARGGAVVGGGSDDGKTPLCICDDGFSGEHCESGNGVNCDAIVELPHHCWPLDLGGFYLWSLWYTICLFGAVAASVMIVGSVFGHYRRKVYGAISPAAEQPSWCSSFLVHCCPYTHGCAMCQEARVVKRAAKSGAALQAPYNGYGQLSEAV